MTPSRDSALDGICGEKALVLFRRVKDNHCEASRRFREQGLLPPKARA